MPEAQQKQSPDWARVPAFVLFFSLGKRTMRPGGMGMTHRMLDALGIGENDDVIEFAPGAGATTRIVLALSPNSYTAIERDRTLQQTVERSLLSGTPGRCVVGKAEETGLEDGCASVVFGEAMLTMQTAATKERIVNEAFRLLQPGGRYGIHETCLVPDDMPETLKDEIGAALTEALRVGARPLTVTEWRGLIEKAGFSVTTSAAAAMHLLEPRRVIQDEGLAGALRFAARIARTPAARRRILGIRRAFKKYEEHLNATMLVATKPE